MNTLEHLDIYTTKLIMKTISDEFIREHHDKMNWSALSQLEKFHLFENYNKLFGFLIDVENLKPAEKWATVVSGSAIARKVRFTPEELLSLTEDQYVQLLNIRKAKSYLIKEKVESFKKEKNRALVFLNNIDWYLNTFNVLPKLDRDSLSHLSKINPGVVDKFITDFSKLGTDPIFWQNMIKFNSKYMDVFLQNTHTLSTKTDVRCVIRSYPEIIKKLDKDILVNSRLNVKEWVLLIREVVGSAKDPMMFKFWSFDQETVEIIRMDSSVALLKGDVRASKQFANSLQFLSTKSRSVEINDLELEPEDEDEDKAVV